MRTSSSFKLVLRPIAFAMLLTTVNAFGQTTHLQARSMAASCSACHGTNGNAAPGMVALAGYPRGDMIKAMADFKSGARPATLMHQLSKGYSEQQVEAIASYFAAQKKN
jgi:cytochrome subunit of sulfide dehydrogenase